MVNFMIVPARTMKICMDLRDIKSIREQTSGFNIFKAGHIAAADGHGSIAFVSNKLYFESAEDESAAKDCIIKFPDFSISKVVDIRIDFKTSNLECRDKDGVVLFMVPFQSPDGVEPHNFKNAYKKHVPSKTNQITIDPANMKRVHTVFPKETDVMFAFGEQGTPSIAIGNEGALILLPRANHVHRKLPEILMD